MACDLIECSCFGPRLIQTTTNDGQFIEATMRDDDSYCILGPGAEAGLKDIFQGAVTAADPKELDKRLLELTVVLRDSCDYCFKELIGRKFPAWRNEKITLKVIEHALCEYGKYHSLLKNHGKLRYYNTRSHLLDKWSKQCASCGSNANNNVRCDTCHYIGCGSCEERKTKFYCIGGRANNDDYSSSGTCGSGVGNWNCCIRCHNLDKLMIP